MPIPDQKEKLAAWMIKHSFATGHGDSFDDLLAELSWQINELKLSGLGGRNRDQPRIPMSSKKHYLGDGVYIDVDQFGINE